MVVVLRVRHILRAKVQKKRQSTKELPRFFISDLLLNYDFAAIDDVNTLLQAIHANALQVVDESSVIDSGIILLTVDEDPYRIPTTVALA